METEDEPTDLFGSRLDYLLWRVVSKAASKRRPGRRETNQSGLAEEAVVIPINRGKPTQKREADERQRHDRTGDAEGRMIEKQSHRQTPKAKHNAAESAFATQKQRSRKSAQKSALPEDSAEKSREETPGCAPAGETSADDADELG